MKKKPILITGATGFLGRHLLQALTKQQGEEQPLALVRSLASWKKQDWTHKLSEVETIQGSVINTKVWREDPRLKGLRGIYHLAAVIHHSRDHSDEMYKTNIEGLLSMVKLAAKHRCRVVFISTSGTVGCFKKEKESADEHAPYALKEVGKWPYYDSKIQAETKARELAKKLGVELVIIRPPVLLGPGDHRFRSTSHILRLLRGKLPFLLKGGIHFIDIRDATQAIIKAMEIKKPQPIYHLGGTATSLNDFFNQVGEIAGVTPPRLHLPIGVVRILAKATKKIDVLLPKRDHPLLPDPVVFEMASKYWGLCSRYARQDLDYVSRDPHKTIADTVQWLRANHEDLRI